MKRARQPFAYTTADGNTVVVLDNDAYEDGHPYVKANPGMFMDLSDTFVVHPADEFDVPAPADKVEAATAAPGEKRTATKRP